MIGWTEGIQNAIEYIEENLTEELSIREIAEKACVSAFHFQRIFNTLCGFTMGEYIRNRRLSLAAQELARSDAKVIDVAMKYGYYSPDSFTRAFARFHGISPSAAKLRGARLKSFARVKLKLVLEGGTMLEYKIVEKEQFTVMGKARNFDPDTATTEIPKFWDEHNRNGDSSIVVGMYGVCIDTDGKEFEYMIADNYLPWNEIPEGYKTRVIPAGTWACSRAEAHCRSRCRMSTGSGASGCQAARITGSQAIITSKCMHHPLKIRMTTIARYGYRSRRSEEAIRSCSIDPGKPGNSDSGRFETMILKDRKRRSGMAAQRPAKLTATACFEVPIGNDRQISFDGHLLILKYNKCAA